MRNFIENSAFFCVIISNMKKLILIFLFLNFAVAICNGQISNKKTDLTKADRTRWFNTLKWYEEDYLLDRAELFENAGFTFYKLDKSTYFVQIIGSTAAYQRQYIYAILDESNLNKPKVKLLKFTEYYFDENNIIQKESSIYVTGISTFDIKEKTLEVFYKGAGTGYCGSLTTYKIENKQVKTIKAKLRNCDESATNVPPPEKWNKIKLF